MSEPNAEAHASHEPVSATEQFLDKHFTKLLLVAALLVVALLAYGFVRYQNKQAANLAAEAFTSAKTLEDCDLVISQHAGTTAAGNARLLKADLLWEDNKKDSSAAVLREFLKEDEGHPLYPQALLGLASKLESMGEADEAQPLFERLANEFPDSSLAALARIRLGDLLWSQGKEDEAKDVYEKLAVDYPNAGDAFNQQNESRLKWLTAKLPTKEVEPPPSAKVEEKKDDPLPGMKAPQIQVPGALGATISPDGGALTPPVSPAGQLQAPPIPMTDGPDLTIPPTVTNDVANDAKAKAKEPSKAKAPAPKKAAPKGDSPKQPKAPAKKSNAPKAAAETPKAKAPEPKKPAESKTPAPAPAPTPATPNP